MTLKERLNKADLDAGTKKMYSKEPTYLSTKAIIFVRALLDQNEQDELADKIITWLELRLASDSN